MIRANPVENLLTQIFLLSDPSGECRQTSRGRRLRDPLRLIARCGRVESTPSSTYLSRHTDVTVHRFEETIDGRAYQIDVTPVSNRWRAQLRRTKGMPTALMPFYGQTPDEAAQLLFKWLALAHKRQTAPSHRQPDLTFIPPV